MKKVFLTLVVFVLILFSVSAVSSSWYQNMPISDFQLEGLINIEKPEVMKVLEPYKGTLFSNEVIKEIQSKLYTVDGVSYVITDAIKNQQGDMIISVEIHELPQVKSISFIGNNTLKSSELTEALTIISQGAFIDTSKAAVLDAAKKEIVNAYSEKGFTDTPVKVSMVDNGNSTVSIQFTVKEGRQRRIAQILFEGNDNATSAMLQKQMTSKKKGLFQPGYLDSYKIDADIAAMQMYYQTLGYLDAIIDKPVIELMDTGKEDYDEVCLTFKIVEGLKWYFGGITVKGNTVFSDEEINAVQTMKIGDVLNMQKVQNDFSAITDLYYNSGYISNQIDVIDKRDDTSLTVSYEINIVEKNQARIEEILITGLEKTKEYVMRREIELHPGDIFSKAKLTTSAQNLFNTGLLTDVNYDMYYGKDQDSVILDFKVKEGNFKDIQFGASFGGDIKGFPISAFLSWTNNNFTGTGQKLTVSTTLSPTKQGLGLSFGDNWFGNKRWSNTFSFDFSREVYENELQLGIGSPEYDGRNEAWPLGYSGYKEWNRAEELYPSYDNLMDYTMLNFSLGWVTGYTWIFDKGRLGLSGGLTVGVKKAEYDSLKYTPFEALIRKYHDNAFSDRFSNRLTFNFQWDGRDYVKNTTKGYLVGLGATYAGGFLQGLANYIKITTNAAGYLKLFDVNHKKTDSKTPVMSCLSTAFSFMLPQYYTNYDDAAKRGPGWHDPRLGATKYEMLYIDGMTVARGFNAITDQSLLWDNMLEVSYQIVKDVVQAEIFTSGTYIQYNLTSNRYKTDGWYFAGGAGLKLKVSGFPLGLYLVKNATKINGKDWAWKKGNLFNNGKEGSGLSIVLAISTSLI